MARKTFRLSFPLRRPPSILLRGAAMGCRKPPHVPRCRGGGNGRFGIPAGKELVPTIFFEILADSARLGCEGASRRRPSRERSP